MAIGTLPTGCSGMVSLKAGVDQNGDYGFDKDGKQSY
jgi:hypothetical protein